ncbi:uncharacterized protein LOC115770871 [Drosophila novamexicana]|uniref:uncharacterized protein LOC115770871 n=1 Tax=Drosophila novamexicana TaxID=47314 RepID=UPI0011E5F550|nr:uncharacterized protein LOC115770871 [Drosophila novamexicana]
MGRYTLVLLFILLGYFAAVFAAGNKTESVAPKERLLSRRVRALVFPNKASVLITAALTKIIVGGRPSGLQYSLEFDMYVPLPDTVEGWRPKILLDHTANKKQPATKPKRRWDWNWQGYGQNSSVYKYPYRRPNMYYRGPYQAETYTKYVKPKTHKDYFYKNPWQLSEEPWQRSHQPTAEEEVYESWVHVPSWKLNRDYRERRAIFDQFEAMGNFFQMDLRSCIKRAMCELKARFNENHGQGMLMEDLLRIILTVPEEITDVKYKHRVDVRDCTRFYAVSCPYRVLEFLSWNVRHSSKKK